MDVAEDFRWEQQQLLAEIACLLQSAKEPCAANALLLNQEVQRRLLQVRSQILSLLQIVKDRYRRNQKILTRRMQPRSHCGMEQYSMSGAILRKGTFHFKGNLYFRDIDGRSCPNNEDYETRRLTEMFPTDFDMRSRHVWTLYDKKSVIMGVKQQLLDHCAYNKVSRKRKRGAIEQHSMSMVSLLAAAGSSFSIDWMQISTLDLKYRHSPFSCEAMWRIYLHPDCNRDEWTTEEDDNLILTATDNQMQNWELIAEYTDRRSDYQCFIRVHTGLQHLIEPGPTVRWTTEENEKLFSMVQRNTSNGIVNWNNIVEHFPGRSKSTLIGRYTYVLHPSISRAPFTAKEDMLLFAAVKEYNGKFHCIPRAMFPNRSLAQLRTRYHNTLAQRTKTGAWTVEDDTKLIDFVTNHGSSQWLNCANFLGNHSRTSCRTRYLVIKRFLEQNPSASVEHLPRRKYHQPSLVTADNWSQCLMEWQENPESLAEAEKSLAAKRSRGAGKKTRIKKTQTVIKYGKTDLEFQEYFKYGYNLSLTAAATFPLPKDAQNLAYAAKALAYHPSSRLQRLQSVAMPQELQRRYNRLMRDLAHEKADLKDPLLPPNWSTMMGLRAICILSADYRKQSNSEELSAAAGDPNPAILLFRRRLRALFFRTTLLSRLAPKKISHLPESLISSVRPTPDIVELGSNLKLGDVDELKAEQLSDDESISSIFKEETEPEYIIP
ncbi:hypothetical protein KR018_003161 [Drosophila ironensis]|nr:hypothetical protein KR018_003161 [Drosophila ironensis]